ncbi:P-loop containing nucleoside triphosphate hydrolase protein [Xylaria acuta]|nr:P-loop containing nucleoside triphosphate hydrolase protein [Xylaria acuta]
MAPTKGNRHVDRLAENTSGAELEVIVLGMPRTGSISMRVALEKLGYKCFHGRLMDEDPRLYEPWGEAIRAKYFGEGELFGRKEFDKMYGDYNAACNYPGTMVAEDLVKAYPNAKIILTNRDVDKWAQSLKQSVDIGRSWKSFDWVAPFDPVYGPWWKYHKLEHAVRPYMAPKGERQGYLDYYARMRSLVPEERLLDYQVSEGWEPVCSFLGKDIPDEPFPRANNTDQFLAVRRWRWWHAVYCMVIRVVPAFGAAAVGVGAVLKYGHILF